MSGFEVVGIVLGAIPLLISALEHYESGIKTIQIVRRRAKVMHSLATALSTEQTILRNTCETLLGGIIDPKDMQPLLAEPFGPLWQDPDTKAVVERRLDHTLKDFKALVHSMKEAVEEIQSKLGLGPDFEMKIDNRPVAKREMVKIALQFSTHEDALKKLADTNQKLDLMITGNLRNEPYRKVHSQEKLFSLLEAVSRSIYNALRSSLSCTCARSHGVGFSLPAARVTRRVQDEEALIKRLDFHLVLANKPQDTKGKAHSSWVWDELVLRLAEIPMKVRAAALLPVATDVVVKKSKFVRVKFLDHDTTTPIVRAPSPLDSAGSTVAPGLDASHQVITNPMGYASQLPRETRQLVQVKDICRTLSGKPPEIQYQDPYGYLLDETTSQKQRFEVFPFRSYDNDECATVHLRDVFSQTRRPSLARKYHIAATAASSVLFMHKTLWMPATLTINNVFLISRYGNVDFDEIYLIKQSLHDLDGSTTASNYDSLSEAAGVSTLYYLGIFLIEVMLWKPIYDFWSEEGVDLSGVPLEDIFDYTTAKGFARIQGILNQIEWIGSPEFKKVVEHCIKCDLDANSLSLDNVAFRQAIYSDIVLPLQDADRLAGGKMTAGKGKPLTPMKVA
ncbi:hypothetical protein F5B22DRAFT_611877 [Xylaria bambusicola]|uniref:uncharacterized protein n=1 Tax=Xylaria bambusicola TaxID=326684 RepID=UPI0020076B8C|nr:uncharacterized protein F5B22DRAFT_611877 [Xylaria bambusicola]KAI0513266.1 hypothetical protein F5B22DRAFT_611877 [Xylaria bambusicola]